MIKQADRFVRTTESKLDTMNDKQLNAEGVRYRAEHEKLTKEISRLERDEAEARRVIAEVDAMTDPKPSDLLRKGLAQHTLEGAPQEGTKAMPLREQIEGLKGLRKIVRTHEALIRGRHTAMHGAFSEALGYFGIAPGKVGNDGDYKAYVSALKELQNKYHLPWLIVNDERVTIMKLDDKGAPSQYDALAFGPTSSFADVQKALARIERQARSEAVGMYMVNAKIQHDMWGIDAPGVTWNKDGSPKTNFDKTFWASFAQSYVKMEQQLASLTTTHLRKADAGPLGHPHRSELFQIAHGSTPTTGDYTTLMAGRFAAGPSCREWRAHACVAQLHARTRKDESHAQRSTASRQGSERGRLVGARDSDRDPCKQRA
jgi:hypothetical protein